MSAQLIYSCIYLGNSYLTPAYFIPLVFRGCVFTEK